jgi:hypothetical protein
VEGYSGDAPWCFLDCLASANPSDDGSLESDGNFFCINGGIIGGSAGSCTCTSCYDGVGGPHCETCAEGYTGDAPWCFLNCQTSDIRTDDGSLEKSGRFYCINGGTIGGIAGQCTCTCPEEFGDSNCATPLCPPGKYKEDEPTFTCTDCPSGKFNTKYGGLSEADCINCVPYTTSNTERTKCLSLEGYYSVEGDDWFQAFPLPEGVLELPGATIPTFELKPGYWRTSVNSSNIETCLNPEHCVGGPNASSYCAEGHTGPLCATCKESYGGVGRSENLSCSKCSGSTSLAVVLGLCLVILLPSLAILFMCLKKKDPERMSSRIKRVKTTFGEVKKKMEKPKKKLKPVFKSKCNPKSCAIVAFLGRNHITC